jgi:hypothetical protein
MFQRLREGDGLAKCFEEFRGLFILRQCEFAE